MVDRWTPIPNSWARDPRFLGLNPRAARILLILHLGSEGELIEAQGSKDVIMRMGLPDRLYLVRQSLEELEDAGFVRRTERGLVLVEHVRTRRANARRTPGKRSPGRRQTPGNETQRSREDTQPPLARAHSEINSKELIKREVPPLEGWRPPLSDEQKADLDRRTAAIRRMLGKKPIRTEKD